MRGNKTKLDRAIHSLAMTRNRIERTEAKLAQDKARLEATKALVEELRKLTDRQLDQIPEEDFLKRMEEVKNA